MTDTADVPPRTPFADRPAAVGVPPLHYGNPIGEQRALAAGEAVVDLSDRSVVTITGPDRLSWLDSLTSQSLKALPPGEAGETLLLDPSGRVEYAARVLDDGVTTWLLLDAGRGAGFAAFLDRMRFMLRVEVADRTADFATVGGFGAAPLNAGGADASSAIAAPAGVPLTWSDPWSHVAAGGHQYALTTEHPAAYWTWSESLVERSRLDELAALPAAGTLAAEALRIAAWRPRQATEGDERTIPHELDWLRTAVHLTKGCYRGQETVAKVHNLGHPPRRLVLLHLDGSEGVLPAPGAAVRLADAVAGADGVIASAGRITAAALHHELGPIALAVVKRSTPVDAGLVVVVPTDADTAGEATEVLVAAAQETIVPPSAGASADVPRLPRLGAVTR